MSAPAFLPRERPAPPQGRFVLPGHLAAGEGPMQITTILGSCVSICLFEPARRIGGLNHFLFSGRPSRHEPTPHRWGEPASEALLERLAALGVSEKSLRAKVFGGAQMGPQPASPHLRIGERNVEWALSWLLSKGILVVGQSVGGRLGRKIIMDCGTGEVWVKELSRE
ncbi:MAG: chemotaxis protein CheD [Bdellovibrionota bacterium]